MSHQQRRIHDPIIDTVENSDDEKVEEIIDSAITQDQLDAMAANQEGSLLGVFNGSALCPSVASPFKKNYTTIENTESLAALPLDADGLTPFGIDLESIHNSPLPTRSKVVDHFSVSVSDSLPSHVMELDSPEPDFYEQEMQDCTEGLLISTNTKELILQTDSLQTSLTAEEREIAIQQAKDLLPSPGPSNGEDFDLNEDASKIALCNEGLTASNLRISQMDTQLDEFTRPDLPLSVTYSQSDIFASQPLTFGLEPKTVDLSPDNLESFDDDSTMGLPDIPEIRTPSKQTSPYSMLREIDYVSAKRKRGEFEDEKVVKKPTMEQSEMCTPFDAESPGTADDDIKILDDTSESVEVIYDNKFQKDSNTQDMMLFLSNTQSTDSQLKEPVPTESIANEHSTERYHVPRVKSSPSPLEQSHSTSNGSSATEQIDLLPHSLSYDKPHTSKAADKLTPAIINLPRFDTPSQVTEESGEALFINATKAARANAPNIIPDNLQGGDDSSPLFSSPAEMPVEKSISSASPSCLQERTKSKQSTPVKTQTPSASMLFPPRSNPTQNRTPVLAEDSDDDIKTRGRHSQTPISSGSSKDDTEVEIITETNDVTNVRDVRNNKWKSIMIPVTKWVHVDTDNVMYSVRGDDKLYSDFSFLKKVTSNCTLPSTGSRISNISSISGLSSDGYLGDKSSSASSYCATSLSDMTCRASRPSMASVVCISPPKKLTLPPLNIVMENRSTQTETDSSPPIVRTRRVRGRPRGRPRGSRATAPSPIPEKDETVLTANDDICSKVVLEIPDDDSTSKDYIKPQTSIACIPIKQPESVDKLQVYISSDSGPESVTVEDYFSKISPSLQEKLTNMPCSLSEKNEKVFRQVQISDDIQNTVVRKIVREIDIAPGILVFARYNADKNYYSGIIKEKGKADRWKIVYNFDNQQSSVREIYILPTDILPKGFPVSVLHHSKDFDEPGVVRGHFFTNNIMMHIVDKLHGAMATVPHSHISLKEADANVLLKARTTYRSLVSSPGGDLALDNILFRRTRGISNSPRKPIRKADPNFDTSGQEDATSSTFHRKSQTRPNLAVTMGASESEYSSSPRRKKSSVNAPRTARSSKNLVMKSTKKSDDVRKSPESDSIPPPLNPVVRLNQLNDTEIPLKDTPKKRGRKPITDKTPKKTRKLNEYETNGFINEYGPIPTESSSLFEGYSILITEMTHPDKLVDFAATPMDKKYLTQQFEFGGGKVVTEFDTANLLMIQESKRANRMKENLSNQKVLLSCTVLKACDSPAKVICVSNAPCRTSKYIRCLTVGIPIVSTTWVINSCKKNECLNWIWHLLPAGISLLTQTMMVQPFHDFDDTQLHLSKVVDVLKGDKVFLATSTNENFQETWLELLCTAQAQVFTNTPSGKLTRLMDRKTSVVIADATIPEDELQRALEIRAPIVSTEWFIQCIIQRCKVQYTAHRKFKYNYAEEEHR